jgi:hypothetical protein
MNKEDIWVARIPLPVRYKADGPVEDRFDGCQPGGAILNWNTYSTQWAPVRVAAFPSEANRSLLFEDRDPYDYAKAVRVFPAADAVRVRWRLFMKRADAGQLEAEVESATGERPVRLTFDSRGSISAVDGTESVNLGACAADRWHTVDLEASRKTRRYRLSLDGKALVVAGAFAAPALTLERLVFRTGPYRTGPSRAFIPLIGHDLPAADKPVAQAAFYIDDVTIR